jgi:parallel beta-helix repeat protein
VSRRAALIVLALALAGWPVAAWAHHRSGHTHGPPTTTQPAPTTATTLPEASTTTEPPLPSTTVTMGTRGPQPGVTQPGGSTAVAPGSSIASAITTAGAGGTVWLQAGLHRLTAGVSPLANQTLLGEYGAVVDGSVVIAGPWTQDGTTWWATGQLPATPNATGVCAGGGTLCQPTENVFYDGRKLTRVANQAAVGPGTFWGDYPGNRIYVGDDPTGHLVEQAKAAAFVHADNATAAGVTIRNLQVRKFANPYQQGAVTAGNGPGTGWVVDQCELYLNHANGVHSFGDNATVSRNVLRDNGTLGLGGFNNANMLVEANLVARNNNGGFDTGWEAGGMKLVTVTDAVVRGNVVADNIGAGIWIDVDAYRVTIEQNEVHANKVGIYYEISFDGTIRHNRVQGNTEEAIFINASGRGSVDHNTVIVPPAGTLGYGLRFAADPARGSGTEPRTLAGWTCADNTVEHKSTSLHAASIYLFNTVDTSYFDAVTFSRNAYVVDNTGANRYWLNQNRTFAQWQAAGKDVDGSVGT